MRKSAKAKSPKRRSFAERAFKNAAEMKRQYEYKQELKAHERDEQIEEEQHIAQQTQHELELEKEEDECKKLLQRQYIQESLRGNEIVIKNRECMQEIEAREDKKIRELQFSIMEEQDKREKLLANQR